MVKYTAAQLHDMTKALFSKHPSAKPECLIEPQHITDTWGWKRHATSNCSVGVMDEAAEHITTGHLARWLAERNSEGMYIFFTAEQWYVRCCTKDRVVREYKGTTLLSALVAAAEAVPCD